MSVIDVLTTMRGLRVSASGATARFADTQGERDPRAIGRELDVELVVDATAAIVGPQIRITARLLEVQSGTQLWSERYDGSLTDVFELQDKLGKRIAEALRLEVEHLTHRQLVPEAAIDEYLRARSLIREGSTANLEQSIEHFERCLALAPGFRLALAGNAFACVRCWFMSNSDRRNWAELANQAVAVARKQADGTGGDAARHWHACRAAGQLSRGRGHASSSAADRPHVRGCA